MFYSRRSLCLSLSVSLSLTQGRGRGVYQECGTGNFSIKSVKGADQLFGKIDTNVKILNSLKWKNEQLYNEIKKKKQDDVLKL